MIGEFGAWTAHAGLGHPDYVFTGRAARREYIQVQLVSAFFTARLTLHFRGKRLSVRLLSPCCSRLLVPRGGGAYHCQHCHVRVLEGAPPAVEWNRADRRRPVLEAWMNGKAHVLDSAMALYDFEALVDALEPQLVLLAPDD